MRIQNGNKPESKEIDDFDIDIIISRRGFQNSVTHTINTKDIDDNTGRIRSGIVGGIFMLAQSIDEVPIKISQDETIFKLKHSN